MAINTSLAFPDSGHDGGIAVGLLTAGVAAGTGAATVFTSGADGARLAGISFAPCEQIASGYIHVYYYNGTSNILAGSLRIPQPWSVGDAPLVWRNPFPNEFVNATRLFKAGKDGTDGVIHALPFASNY